MRDHRCVLLDLDDTQMTKETGGPAFPTEVWDSEGIPQHTQGMTLRDYFAAHAMQSMFARNKQRELVVPLDECAKVAYEWADAMLKAREQ